MYKKVKFKKTLIHCNDSYEAEPLEVTLRRVVENNEPIDAAAPIIYTPREDGVLPQFDVRTDRWDVALEATDKISKSLNAKREDAAKPAETTKPESPAEQKAA